MTYQAIYKCRLCGETFERIGFYEECVEKARTFNSFTKSNITLEDTALEISVHIHSCAGGSIGIADFQGFKAVKV